MSFADRIANLDKIKDSLTQELGFWLGRKDWDRVNDMRRRLRLHAEQVARVVHLYGKAA